MIYNTGKLRLKSVHQSCLFDLHNGVHTHKGADKSPLNVK